MKIKMAANLMQAYSKGEKETCGKYQDQKVVEAYCNKNFAGDPKKIQGCKVIEIIKDRRRFLYCVL